MPTNEEHVTGVKIHTFPNETVENDALVTGLKTVNGALRNVNFTFATILTWVRQKIADFYIPLSTKGSANGVASLDGAGKVTDTQIPFSSNNPLMDGTASAGTATTLSRSDHRHPSDTSKISTSEKGAASGVASLGSDGKVPSAQLPTIPSASSTTPQNLGTAAAGSSTDYSRADHVHNKPTAADVGAQPTITASGILMGDGQGGVSTATPGTDYATPGMIPTTPADIGALPADGTAVNAEILAVSHTVSGNVGWYKFFEVTANVGASRSFDFLITNTYNRQSGILRLYFNNSGTPTIKVNFLSGTIPAGSVRWEYTDKLTLYIYKESNADGYLQFRVFSNAARTGNSLNLSTRWKSEAVSEPTGAAFATADILQFTAQVVSAGTNQQILSISNTSITEDHVLARIEFTDPAYITAGYSWLTADGSFTLTGTATAATTANILLVRKGN